MTLERFGTRLDDYLDGTLADEERREIEEVLASSQRARRELEDYRRMIEELARLPESIEPERDLFPAIEARLDAIEARPDAASTLAPWRWLVLAASLTAALGVTYLMTRSIDPEIDTSPVVTTQEAALTATSRAEDDLVAATDQLKRALEVNRAALPPETRRLVERNLEIIQTAIAEIQLALDRDPGNRELNRALVAYYQHELALLEQVNRAASRL